VDGKLDEPAWKAAAFAQPFRDAEGKAADPQTQIHLLCDGERLYVAVRAAEPLVAKLTAVDKGRDVPVTSGDHVAIALSPEWRTARPAVYRFIVNANGALLDTDTGDAMWSPEVTVGAAKSEKDWTVELAVPFAALGVKPETLEGRVWAFSVVRRRAAGDERSVSSWTRIAGSGPDGVNWGHVLFQDVPVKEKPEPEPPEPNPKPEPEPKSEPKPAPEPPDAGAP
jgi:hypothetical protein